MTAISILNFDVKILPFGESCSSFACISLEYKILYSNKRKFRWLIQLLNHVYSVP